ncbi:MAG: hypothetical protein ACKOPO_09940 [Novosphingobium sp.]
MIAPLMLVPVAVLPGAAPDRIDPVAPDGAALTASTDNAENAWQWGEADGAPILTIMSTMGRDAINQVSIEQRLIIRISPQMPAQQRTGILADLPRKSIPPKFEERSMGKCVPVAGIAGVQIAQDNKLVLFMRDTRIVRAGLDKGCTAQDFYSGFYVQRTGDGQMCSGRDKLQSRNGANCKLGKLKQLIPSN